MPGLLDEMRVLDVSVWRPMPHATQILRDLGAEVLKVEPPGGDPMRAYPELFAALARGKRSIELDLKQEAGQTRVLELVRECDVFCEAWRPGVADRLGLGAARLRAERPELIYCSISGYGQGGPLRVVPGHDLNFQALGGALSRRAPTEPDPAVPRLPTADLESGTLAALLVCAAWARRVAHGQGERIDVAMADVVAWWVGPRSVTAVGPEAARPGGSPGYGVFASSDGEWLTLAPLTEPHLWASICTALGLDDLADVPFTERLARADDLNHRIAACIATMPLAVALERLHAAGAPVAPVLTPEAAAAHPQFVARETLAEIRGTAVPLLPAILDEHPRLAAAPIPRVGEHPSGFTERARPS